MYEKMSKDQKNMLANLLSEILAHGKIATVQVKKVFPDFAPYIIVSCPIIAKSTPVQLICVAYLNQAVLTNFYWSTYLVKNDCPASTYLTNNNEHGNNFTKITHATSATEIGYYLSHENYFDKML